MSHETLTPVPTPERSTELRHWDMETQPDHPETSQELLARVADKVRLWHDGDARPYPERPLVIDLPQDAAGMTNAAEMEVTVAQEWIKSHEPTDSWWLQSEKYRHRLADDIFGSKQPTEQFIIGQGDRGIRFYNFDEPLSENRQDDLQKFVDVAHQYVGDKIYDLLQDVVITKFASNADKGDGHSTTGFAPKELPGVIFMDADLLQRDVDKRQGLEASPIVQWLVHELYHYVQGNDAAANHQILNTDEAIGWNIEQMTRDYSQGIDLANNLDKYRPPAFFGSPITDIESDQVREILAALAKHKHQNGMSEELNGSPSEYGASAPVETLPEVARHAMLGSVAVNELLPKTRDAFLEHLEQRRGEPIVVSMDREPIALEHRTGRDILYPRTQLPNVIDAHAVPVKYQTAA